MRGRIEHVVRGADFHDLTRIHDRNAVRHVRNDAEVVRDENDGELTLLIHAVDQFEDLRLNGDVERRCRLVADENIGIGGQRDRDDDTLAHTARKLKRILTVTFARFGNADLFQQFQRARFRHIVRDLIRDVGRLLFEPIDHRHGALVKVDGTAPIDLTTEVLLHAHNHGENILCRLAEIDEFFIGDLVIRLFAAGDLPLVSGSLTRITRLFFLIALDSAEILLDRRAQARCKRIRAVVFDDFKTIDPRFHGGNQFLRRRIGVVSVDLGAGKHGFQPLKNFERRLLLLRRYVVRIDEPLLRKRDEVEHEILVEILQKFGVRLGNGQLGERLPREREVIPQGKEVGLLKRHGFGKDLADLFERCRNRLAVELKFLHLFSEKRKNDPLSDFRNRFARKFFQRGDLAFQLFRTVMNDIPLDRSHGLPAYHAHVGNQRIRRILFDFKQKIVNALQCVGRSLVRPVVGVFERKVTAFKFVERPALCGIFRIVAARGVHGKIQPFQRGVEVLARLALRQFALDEHCLRHLPADAHDGIEG